MNDELVTVTFDPVRECRISGNSYIFSAEGHEDVVLPVKVFCGNVPGKVVKTIDIPKWLALVALEEGLVEDDVPHAAVDEQYVPPKPPESRHDWFVGCAIIGLLMRYGYDSVDDGNNTEGLLMDAREIADKAVE